MGVFYLDASAVAPMFLIDAHSSKMTDWLAPGRNRIISSDFAAAEFAAIVSRRIRTAEITLDQADIVLGDFDDWRIYSTTRRLASAGDIAACERPVRRFDLKPQAPDALTSPSLSLTARRS